jgi:hypothetical protein
MKLLFSLPSTFFFPPTLLRSPIIHFILLSSLFFIIWLTTELGGMKILHTGRTFDFNPPDRSHLRSCCPFHPIDPSHSSNHRSFDIFVRVVILVQPVMAYIRWSRAHRIASHIAPYSYCLHHVFVTLSGPNIQILLHLHWWILSFSPPAHHLNYVIGHQSDKIFSLAFIMWLSVPNLLHFASSFIQFFPSRRFFFFFC